MHVWRIRGAVLIGCILIGLLATQSFLKETEEAQPVPEPVIAPVIEDTRASSRVDTVGYSLEGRLIEAYTFGTGDTMLLLVGGIHGGYEWNSVLLAYEFIDYYTNNPKEVPEELTLAIIPALNPDGLVKIIGKDGRFTMSDVPVNADTSSGRFNANGVDLNRNFDCKWQPKATWRGREVSAGTAPFSEPESKALKDFIEARRPSGVVFWHSKANAVYASECTEGILPNTRVLMDTYASAAQYPSIDVFDAYPVTGDSEGWLASIGIPAITVELETRDSLEWDRNLRGVRAVVENYMRAR